jgi:hypothetical protein
MFPALRRSGGELRSHVSRSPPLGRRATLAVSRPHRLGLEYPATSFSSATVGGAFGQTEAMSNAVTAELSSLSLAADALRDRVGALTGNLAGANHENVVLVLYEVERALVSASRQLARAERISRAVR